MRLSAASKYGRSNSSADDERGDSEEIGSEILTMSGERSV